MKKNGALILVKTMMVTTRSVILDMLNQLVDRMDLEVVHATVLLIKKTVMSLEALSAGW